MSETVLDVRGLTRTYRSGDRDLTVLRDVSFAIDAGTTCAIVGPSGSGKTTLLGLCAGLDQPTAGSVLLDGEHLADIDEDGRARLRRDRVGFVFQTFQLIPTLRAIENVAVPLELCGESNAAERAAGILDRVGLGARLDHYPAQLSGGEQQRVALARAVAAQPRLLLADEPTGNLDGETGRLVIDLLFGLQTYHAMTLLLITHDGEIARRCDRIARISDGRMCDAESEGVANRHGGG